MAHVEDADLKSRRLLSAKQVEGWNALCGPATHVLLAGGARSGKTWDCVRFLCVRAMGAPEATQAVLRLRFNHLKASVIYDTLPAVMAAEFPGQKLYTLNKSDWFAQFTNGHRIYFGGLDDKERTEKILGQGHSTIYLNECSQISYASRLKAITRLSQNKGLRLKAIYDENPPIQGHWTHKIWVKGLEPSTGQKLANPHAYAFQLMNPGDNPFLPPETLEILANLPKRERDRFYLGLFGQAVDGPLWTYESIDAVRAEFQDPRKLTINFSRIIVAVDPSGCHGPEDKRSDEVGIVVAGVDAQGVAYVLEDASGRFGPGGKDGWGQLVCNLFYKWKADAVIGEANYGGAMVGNTISSVDPNVPFREVHAARGKAVRAEPVSALYDRKLIRHCGAFPELEEQMLQFSTSGYNGDKSPDRADAMVWAMYDLCVIRAPGVGLIEWYRQQAEAKKNLEEGRHNGGPPLDGDEAGETSDGATVVLAAPENMRGVVYAMSGTPYQIESGRVTVSADDEESLTNIGFRRPQA